MIFLRIILGIIIFNILASCTNGSNTSARMYQVHGTVQSGVGNTAYALSEYTINLYEINESSAGLIQQTTSDVDGKFSFKVPQENAGNQLYYITASNNKYTKFALVIGKLTESSLTINELTTVAAAYSMAQFWHGDLIYGPTQAIQIAADMNQNLVAITNGASSQVISSPPNEDQTNAWRLTNTLANAITACVINNLTCFNLFNSTRSINNDLPSDTLQALQNLAHNPAQGINEILNLSHLSNAYSPLLEIAPDAWTIALKFNQTGSEDCPFGGPGNFSFDKNGYLWITNNVVQGTPNSTNCMIVLQPNGLPADGSNSTVTSPVYGGGILGAGFGISIDQTNNIWLGNFGWGSLIPNGSVSMFNQYGVPLSGESGYTDLVYRVQGLEPDSKNNIWIASNGNQRLVVYPKGNAENGAFISTGNLNPFDIVINNNDNAWVSFNNESSIGKYQLDSNGNIQQLTSVSVGQSPLGLDLDSHQNVWVSTYKESSIYMVNADNESVVHFSGGGIVATWDVLVDGDDNVYAINFFPNSNNQYGIAKLCGVSRKNCPPNATLGTPITPTNGYTLPTGGKQVLLSNGEPLYGPNSVPDFHPLMRMTAGHIDKAGNLWVTNNWKPDFAIDLTSNPGGDGMVVFIGLAKPKFDN